MIAASQEDVFDLFEDEARFFEVRPTAVAHEDVTPLPGGGHDCIQVYEIGGRRITQVCRTLRFEPPNVAVSEAISSGVRMVSTLTFDALAEGTQLSIEREIAIERRGLWRGSRALQRQYDAALQRSLHHIKAVAEVPS